MISRPFNFSAGPAAVPEDVLRTAAAEMLDWHGTGMSVMEMSHRGKAYGEIIAAAERDLRELLAVPEHFRILFMQGGGLGHNGITPLNLAQRLPGHKVDMVVTGAWSQKSAVEAKRYADVHIAADNTANGHTAIPDPATWRLRDGASYVHVCTNETIHGVEFHALPDLTALGCDAPLVIDCSSHILSRPIDWTRVGCAFAGAQKNIGAAGLTIVIVREDLIGHAMAHCPSAFDYKNVAANASMYNTPPTYAIYIAGLVFQWLKAQGGVAAMERRALEKSTLLYEALDASPTTSTGERFYQSKVQPAARSRMNVTWFLPNDTLTSSFLDLAQAQGLLQLKGHKALGGVRASIYNAMPLAGVQKLVLTMREFAHHHG
jgi:phosphoserine aminotransferase